MPEETPNFSSTPITPKKLTKKRTYRRRPQTDLITSTEKKAISKNLTSIYEEGGLLPNMKSITIKRKGSLINKLIYLVILGGLIAAAAWFGFFTLSNKNQSNDYQIKIGINGPTEITTGITTNYELTFQNNDSVILKNVVITVKYPKNFIFESSSVDTNNPGHTEWAIGSLSPRQKGNITITGVNFGMIGEESSWRVLINYQPENFNSILQQIATLNTKIAASPFTIAINGPNEAVGGGDSQYEFTLVNSGNLTPAKMEFIPSWPEFFSLVSSTPSLNQDKKWIIQADASTVGAKSFILTGKWSGRTVSSADTTEKPLMKAILNLPLNGKNYTLAEATKPIVLAENTIGLNLAINGSVKDVSSQPGDMLNISLKLDNHSKQSLKKGTLKLTIATPSIKKQSALNWSAISDKFDADIQGKQLSDTIRQAMLIWTAQKIADLANIQANKTITADIGLPIKDIKSFDWTDVKNPQITAVAQIDYTEEDGSTQSIMSNPVVVTVNSDFKLERRDAISTDAAGKEKHNITWILTNSVHPIKNIIVSADIFGDVSLAGPTEVPAGNFQYDSVAKKIIWTIPDMPESVDILALPFSITINTKNPTQNTLVSKVRVQAEDSVTLQPLNLLADEIALVE